MKNVLMIVLLMVFALNTNAQQMARKQKMAKTETERNIRNLTHKLNNILDGGLSPEQQDVEVIGAITKYLHFHHLNNLANQTCDNVRTSKYIAMFHDENFGEVPISYINKLGDPKKDCALSEAIQIYEMTSANPDLIGPNRLYGVIGCGDTKDSRMAKSRGKSEVWYYTGVKKLFTDKDNFGWRYLCISGEADQRPDFSEEDIKKEMAQLERELASTEERDENPAIPPTLQRYKASWVTKTQVAVW